MPSTKSDSTKLMKKKGICYRCMFGDHQHCYGPSPNTDCRCQEMLHQIDSAKMDLGQHPDFTPQPFPEDPAANDRFYFIPAPVIIQDGPAVRRLVQ